MGAMGVYRAAFTTMEQTAELTSNKVTVPIVGLGGAMAQGKRVHNMLRLVAESVTGGRSPIPVTSFPRRTPQRWFGRSCN